MSVSLLRRGTTFLFANGFGVIEFTFGNGWHQALMQNGARLYLLDAALMLGVVQLAQHAEEVPCGAH